MDPRKEQLVRCALAVFGVNGRVGTRTRDTICQHADDQAASGAERATMESATLESATMESATVKIGAEIAGVPPEDFLPWLEAIRTLPFSPHDTIVFDSHICHTRIFARMSHSHVVHVYARIASY